MMARRVRLVWVMTHPVQYYSPWFRFIEQESEDLELTVLYVTEPAPAQQGVGFGEAFAWNVPLREGYRSSVLRPAKRGDRFDSGSFLGLDAPGMRRALEELDPDAVVVNGWHSLAQVRAILSGRSRGFPLLYRGDTHLGKRASGLRHVLWSRRSRMLLGLFDRFLCVGERAREYLRHCRVPAERIFRSPHAVDNDYFADSARAYRSPEARAEARRTWGIAADEFVALFVGKMDENKRPADLIRAARHVRRDVRLVFVGTGPLRDECERLAAELQVSAVFPGFLNQAELPRAYALADCLVVPSERESWGLVVNEALATGLPCVVSDGVGCAPDLIDVGVTGEVFPAGNFHELAARLDLIGRELESSHHRAPRCLEKIRDYSFAVATEGLVSACRSLVP